MTNTHETKRQLPAHTKWRVRFRDVRGSKIDTFYLHHCRMQTDTDSPDCMAFVRSRVVHLKAKRSALCRSKSSVHTALTSPFRKVRHTFIYALLFNNFPAISGQTAIRKLPTLWGEGRPPVSCSAMASVWRVKAKLSLCLIMHCCMTAAVWTSRGTVPRIPNFSRWAVSFTPLSLYP
jgi:hypothetical protein